MLELGRKLWILPCIKSKKWLCQFSDITNLIKISEFKKWGKYIFVNNEHFLLTPLRYKGQFVLLLLEQPFLSGNINLVLYRWFICAWKYLNLNWEKSIKNVKCSEKSNYKNFNPSSCDTAFSYIRHIVPVTFPWN